MSRDEFREVDVQIRGNETEAQQGHQISMKDRDPTAMNDHVKVKMFISGNYFEKSHFGRIELKLFPWKTDKNGRHQTKAIKTTSTTYTLTFERLMGQTSEET